MRRELAHHQEQLFFVGEVPHQAAGFRELQGFRFLEHDEGPGLLLEGDPAGANLPRRHGTLDETRLSGADADRFDGDVLFDADRAVGRLQLGVRSGILDHQVARSLDR